MKLFPASFALAMRSMRFSLGGLVACAAIAAIAAFVAFAVVAVAGSDRAIAGGMDQVAIKTPGGTHSWTVELASDDASRSKGLMFRREMAPQTGMLFRFEATRQVSMWMKNTYIPLDMIFANQAGIVTHIHRGAVPESLAIISSRVPARFVLEVNAGEADRYGVTVGSRLAHPWILPGG